jgi:hypothetical protein
MFGGAAINIPNVVPSDIVIENNVFTKDVLWRSKTWTVKNLFEIKNGRRILVRGNTFENNWGGSQPGYAIVLTPRNSSGTNPWATVEDVEFNSNIIRHAGGAFNILGRDDTHLSKQLARLKIENNLVYDISASGWAGSGTFAQIGGNPADVTIDHNTILHTGNVVTFYLGLYFTSSGTKVTAPPVDGFAFTNNMLKHNAYGIFGSGRAYGNDSINYYAPGAIVTKNVFAIDKSVASRYPAGNLFPTVAAFMATFVNPAAEDYRLVTGSPYIGIGTDGANLGCTLPGWE